ncbi:MAG: hypothetical protein J6A73_00220 [Lachnospiraceae bacterium]|nr:hypothetical protein [Lachnospiraceae bacterium]
MEHEWQKLKSSDPNTIINKAYIESNEYRRKFDDISENQRLNRVLYGLAKKMLIHRNGTFYEDMYWIDADTCKVVARELTSQEEKKIIYSKKTKKVIKGKRNLITIHSHPNGFPPSTEDFNACYHNHYVFGVVCGHNGKVYVYTSESFISKGTYLINIHKLKKNGYDENEAQLSTLQKMSVSNKIKVKEV